MRLTREKLKVKGVLLNFVRCFIYTGWSTSGTRKRILEEAIGIFPVNTNSFANSFPSRCKESAAVCSLGPPPVSHRLWTTWRRGRRRPASTSASARVSSPILQSLLRTSRCFLLERTLTEEQAASSESHLVKNKHICRLIMKLFIYATLRQGSRI